VNEKRSRLWLYGEKWLFMFHLSEDFPIADPDAENGAVETPASKKRKRDFLRDSARKGISGAGDAVPQSEAPVAKVRKFNSGKSDGPSKATWIDLGGTRPGVESDDDDDVEANYQALISLRRPAADDGTSYTADASAEAGVSSDEKEDGPGEDKARKHETWWHSFKYRPILGIVPVGEDGQPLEVVLVERPAWDLDLPPRFVGSHE
jgi:U3 small nucleolar RNA-associated protein 4